MKVNKLNLNSIPEIRGKKKKNSAIMLFNSLEFSHQLMINEESKQTHHQLNGVLCTYIMGL